MGPALQIRQFFSFVTVYSLLKTLSARPDEDDSTSRDMIVNIIHSTLSEANNIGTELNQVDSVLTSMNDVLIASGGGANEQIENTTIASIRSTLDALTKFNKSISGSILYESC